MFRELKALEEIAAEIRTTNALLVHLSRQLGELIEITPHPRTTNLQIAFGGRNLMDITLSVGQTTVATAVPFEADGTTQTPGAAVSGQTWTTSDATIASFVDNGDGSATFTAVAAGTATATVTGTVTDSDGAVGSFTGTATITVSAPTGRTASLGILFATAK